MKNLLYYSSLENAFVTFEIKIAELGTANVHVFMRHHSDEELKLFLYYLSKQENLMRQSLVSSFIWIHTAPFLLCVYITGKVYILHLTRSLPEFNVFICNIDSLMMSCWLKKVALDL
jgi:hypothetical protein